LGLDFASRRAIFERALPAAPALQGTGRRSLPSRASGWQSVEQRSNQKEHARKEIREAMMIESEEQLTQAVRDGAAVGLDAQELREARGILAKLRLREPARQALARAIDRGTEKGLEDAVALGDRAGLSDEQLREARQLLVRVKSEVIRRVLVDAVASGDECNLRDAVERADRLRMHEESDEVCEARRALRKLVLLNALKEALRSQYSNSAELHRALGEARLFGEFTEEELRVYSVAAVRQAIRNSQTLSIEDWQAQIESGTFLGLQECDLQPRRSFIVMWRDAIESRDATALQAVLAEGRRLLVPDGFLASAQRALAEKRRGTIEDSAASASGLVKSVDDGLPFCAICFEGGDLVAMPCCSRQNTSNVLHAACTLLLSRCPFCRTAICR